MNSKIRKKYISVIWVFFFYFLGIVILSGCGGGGNKGQSESVSTTGFAIINSAGCMECHTIKGSGGIVGPDLSTIGSTLSANGIKVAVDYMVKGGYASLSPAEISTVVNYLSTLTAPSPAVNTASGETIMQSAGCLGCHTINGSSPTAGVSGNINVGPDLSTIGSTLSGNGIQLAVNYMSSDVLYASLSPSALSTVVNYLSTLTAPSPAVNTASGETIMQSAGCFGCHTVNGEGGVGPDLSTIGSTLSPDGIKVAVNYMTSPNMLSDFLSSSLTQSDVAAVVNYLSTLTAPSPAVNTASGETIMQSAGCFGCHTVNGEGGVGPDLSTIGSTINSNGIGIGVNYMASNIMSSGVNTALSSYLSTIESYLGTLQGPATTGYTNGKPLYEGASSTMVQLQETCLLCHSGPGYNGATTTFSASPGPNFYTIAPIGSLTASDMNSTYFENQLTPSQLNQIINQINNSF